MERELNFQQTHVILLTIPSVFCRTTFRNLEVRISGNIKKQSKNILYKNWNNSYHMACHNSCSKCPRRHPRHSSIALSMMVWSMPC